MSKSRFRQPHQVRRIGQPDWIVELRVGPRHYPADTSVGLWRGPSTGQPLNHKAPEVDQLSIIAAQPTEGRRHIHYEVAEVDLSNGGQWRVGFEQRARSGTPGAALGFDGVVGEQT